MAEPVVKDGRFTSYHDFPGGVLYGAGSLVPPSFPGGRYMEFRKHSPKVQYDDLGGVVVAKDQNYPWQVRYGLGI